MDGVVQQLHGAGEKISADARHRADDVNARASQLLEGNDPISAHTPPFVGEGFCADQVKCLCDALAIGFDVVHSPDHHGDGVGVVAFFVPQLFDECVGGGGAPPGRGGGGHGCRVSAVCVPAGGEGFGT